MYLLFPIWLFKHEIHQVFPNLAASPVGLPYFWVALSVPFLLFLLGGVLPFFVGIYRYRSQVRAMLQWQEDWLREVFEINKLPFGDTRIQAFDEKLENLREEIREGFSQNQLFHFYQNLTMPEADEDAKPLPALPALPEPSQAAPQAPQVAVGVGTPVGLDTTVRAAKQFLKGIPVAHTDAAGGLPEQIMAIVRENQSNLVDWDIRFRYLDKLLRFYRVIPQGKSQDIGAFVEASLQGVGKTVSAVSSRKNVLAGTLLTAASSTVVLLIKAFQDDILNVVRHLVR